MVAGPEGEHPDGRYRWPDGKWIAFKDHASEFTLHHLCYFLFVRSESGRLTYVKGTEIRLHLFMGGVGNNSQPCLKLQHSPCLLRAAVETECDWQYSQAPCLALCVLHTYRLCHISGLQLRKLRLWEVKWLAPIPSEGQSRDLNCCLQDSVTSLEANKLALTSLNVVWMWCRGKTGYAGSDRKSTRDSDDSASAAQDHYSPLPRMSIPLSFLKRDLGVDWVGTVIFCIAVGMTW